MTMLRYLSLHRVAGCGLSGIRSGVAVIALSLAFVVASPARQAQAAECRGIAECIAAAKSTSLAVKLAVTALLREYLEPMIIKHLNTIAGDVYPLMANQESNDLQHVTNMRMIFSDREAISEASAKLTALRAELAVRFLPARTVCRTYARERFSNEHLTYRLTGLDPATSLASKATNGYKESARNAVDLLTNVSSKTDKGQLYAIDQFVKDSSKFCDPDVLQPPSGFPCTGTDPKLRFLPQRPGEALFNVRTIKPGSDEEEAARLLARLLTQPFPPDPVRGSALTRKGGQAAYVMGMSDKAAYSLAQGAIDHMIDQRLGEDIGTADIFTDATAAEKASLIELRYRSWGDAKTKRESVEKRPENFTSANYDELAPLVGETNKLFWTLYNNLERVAALKAAHLARVTRAHGMDAAGLATRQMNN